MSSRYLDWEATRDAWPNCAASQFVDHGGYRWHVQRMGPAGNGAAPVCLLLHGTGAATHSWRDVLPRLAGTFDTIAIDLPGHGFTRANFGQKVTLPAIATSVAGLMDMLEARPALIIGHSAGTAIGAQLLLDRQWPCPLVGFTPALMPFPGLAAKLFPSLARILFTNPFTAIIFSRLASSQGETARFLKRATGSTISAEGIRCYEQLFSTSGHCDGAIRMMANWQLEPLRDRLSELAAPVLLVRAAHDNAITAASISDAAALIPRCEIADLAAVGHLAHEERPELAVSLIRTFAGKHGIT